PLVAGVFQNQPLLEVIAVAEVGLDLVQLHGDEGLEACAECGVPGIHVVHVPPALDSEGGGGEGALTAEHRAALVVEALKPGFAAAVLLDTVVKGARGGTGTTFDHEVARAVGEMGVPVIVAGGLTPDNVKEVVAETHGWGLDVSSGVEASKGIKGPDLVRQFVGEARQA
ncbi:unnamed protein product, partial [Discosporangium mesarthrocarpum]